MDLKCLLRNVTHEFLQLEKVGSALITKDGGISCLFSDFPFDGMWSLSLILNHQPLESYMNLRVAIATYFQVRKELLLKSPRIQYFNVSEDLINQRMLLTFEAVDSL